MAAIVTIILAALTACLALDSNNQLTTIQGLVREMQAARRPWVPANATVSLPLTYYARMASVPTGEEPSRAARPPMSEAQRGGLEGQFVGSGRNTGTILPHGPL